MVVATNLKLKLVDWSAGYMVFLDGWRLSDTESEGTQITHPMLHNRSFSPFPVPALSWSSVRPPLSSFPLLPVPLCGGFGLRPRPPFPPSRCGYTVGAFIFLILKLYSYADSSFSIP